MKNSNEYLRKKIIHKSKENYVKRFRVYPYFMYSRLDRWLKRMSKNGLHVVHAGLFTFVFEKGAPEETEYFTYGLSTQEGFYSVSLRHHNLEGKYGLNKSKSKINANEVKKYQIVEIDLKRIDIKTDVGYKELIHDRNYLYMRHFLRNLLALSIPFLLLALWMIIF